MIPLPAGHEPFVRIGAPANALSAGVPIRTKALRELRALAVQSFSFRTRSFIGEHWRSTTFIRTYLDNQKSCQRFNAWFFIPHHSDFYTETGSKVLTGKYKWTPKKGHI